jgi:hypothetical protein
MRQPEEDACSAIARSEKGLEPATSGVTGGVKGDDAQGRPSRNELHLQVFLLDDRPST